MSESSQPTRLGDFELIRELGSGGMGAVWLAKQVSLDRYVALKVLAPHVSVSPTSLQRFQREAEAGARLTHPNIVVVHSVGEADGTHYIAQELVEGAISLADRIKADRDLPELPKDYYENVAVLFAKIADALQHAHEGGIIHRDVKPSNILLTEDGEPKVADFGLAQVEDALELSRTGEFAGTPFYMSPEQAMTKRMGLDHRTDVFSLGVTLWEVLALQRPFEGDTSQQVLEKIITEDPVDPQKIRSRCPRDLGVICKKALEKEPNRRFQSMTEFTADLRRFLANHPIRSKPPTLAYNTWSWVRRHSAASLILCTFFSGLLISLILWQRSVRSNETAVAALDALQGMIAVLEPTSTSNTPQRTRELLATAEALIRSKVDSPSLRANVLTTLARVLRENGEYREALRLQDEVLSIYQNGGFADQKVITDIQSFRGNTLHDLGDLAEAKSVFHGVLIDKKKLYGVESESVYATLDSLGIVEAKLGNFEEAERLLRSSLAGREKILGKNDLRTLDTLNNLAGVLNGLGKVSEASDAFERVLSERRRLLGDDHPDTLSVMGNLGAHYATIGNLAKAVDIFKAVLKGKKSSLGNSHADTLLTQHNFALLLQDLGRLEESEEVAREALELLRDSQGNSHPLTLATMSVLAGVMDQRERYYPAASLHKEAVVGLRAKLGDTHPATLDVVFRYAQHLLEVKEYKLALEMVRLALPGHVKQFGEKHPYTLSLRDDLKFLETKGLIIHAWALVDPDRKDKDTDIAEGLVIIQNALEGSVAETLCHHGGNCPYDTLAWAHFANGNYGEAIAASERALELTPEDNITVYQGYLDRLKKMIAEQRE